MCPTLFLYSIGDVVIQCPKLVRKIKQSPWSPIKNIANRIMYEISKNYL